MNIHANFSGGNIEFVSQQDNIFQLNIRQDNNAKFFQWFYFAVSGQANRATKYQLLNANQATYPDGWKGYQAVMSYDRQEWTRVETNFDGEKLTIQHTPEQDLVFYAYFAPYSYEDYLNWIANIQYACDVKLLTTSSEGRMLHLLQIGTPATHKKKCWITARQHPGEIMASWYVENLVESLLDSQDATMRKLLEQAVFYVVPLMNPDGAAHGNLRTNANGLDLNRQWQNPDKNLCPEVFHTLEKMREIGVDFFIDAHGDEGLPYVFLADCRDNLQHTDRQTQLEDAYSAALMQFSQDFQTEFGYGISQFNDNTPKLACNAVGAEFECLSFTLEMPFKDNANLPDAQYGWSPERSANLAYNMLQALNSIVTQLR